MDTMPALVPLIIGILIASLALWALHLMASWARGKPQEQRYCPHCGAALRD
jgi:hypothetical protein